MLRLLLTGILLSVWTLTSIAQIDEEQLAADAAELFESSSFAAAYPLYAQLVSLNPKDPDLNFRFGACALYTGEEKSKAIKHLTFAISRGVQDPRAYYYLGKAYHLNYEFDMAKKAYSEYLEKVSPKEKNILPAERGLAMCNQGQNLLTNIQEIVVLEKTNAENESFFRYYNLEEIGGKVLTTPDELLTKLDQKMGHRGVIHFQPNSGAVYFSSYGKDGKTGKDIYKAYVLPDGQFSTPEKLPDVINTPYDEDYAFLHSDGVSFYFASKGHNSMGGYDIFKSTVDPITGDFTPVQNLDFAINTPDDDIFYVVDSLHQNAYFASSRSSQQGEMHVYKVMVQGIPMQLLFVAGQFTNTINNNQKVAQIEVYDELTGRPIASTKSSNESGEFLISFPKPGLYRYKVFEEGSQIIHEGVVDVPMFDKPVALAQELQIVDQNGLEKLVIINSFDQPLDVDLTALSAEILRQKAGLDVNADENLIKEANELANPTVEIEKAHIIAGFNEEETPDLIIGQLTEEADARKQLAESLKNQAAMGMETARDAFELSNKYMEDAVSSMRDKSPENTDNYLDELKTYNELINKAEAQRLLAANAVAATEKLLEESAKQQAAALEIEQNVMELEAAIETENADEVVQILTEERERRLVGDNEVKFDLKEKDLSLATTLEKQLQKQGERLSNLREEEVRLQRDIELKMDAANATKKKKEKESLLGELQNLQADLRLTREEIEKVDQQIAVLAKDEEALRNAAELYDIFQEMEASRPGGRVAPDADAIADLADQVNHNEEVLSMLSRSDELAIAESSEELRSTRNDIIHLPTVKEKADELQITLLSADHQQSAYDLAVNTVKNNEVGSEVKVQLLAKQNLEVAQEQIDLLRTVTTSSPEEQVKIDAEIERWESLITNLKSDASNVAEVETDIQPASEPEALDILAGLNPQTKEDYEATLNALEPELSLLDKKLSWVADSKQLILDRIKANEVDMLASDDQAEFNALQEETQAYNAALKWIENEELNSGDLQMAYENDKKKIMESDAPYETKLRDQIRITEEFLQLTKKLSSDPSYNTELAQLKLMEDQALSKLESYESDLELTLNASDEPVEDDFAAANANVFNELETLSNTTEILEIPSQGTETELISALAPNYLTQKQLIEDQVTEEDLLQQAGELAELDQLLIDVLENQKQLRVIEMDQTDDENEKDFLQTEIQQIQQTISKLTSVEQPAQVEDIAQSAENADLNDVADNVKSDINNPENSDSIENIDLADTTESTEIVEHDLLTPEELTDVSRFNGYPDDLNPEMRKTYLTFLTAPTYDEADELENFAALDLVMANTDQAESIQKNLDLVRSKNAEIEELTIEQKLAEKKSARRKLEKKIEKAYFEKAKAEIKNSKSIAAEADVYYETQDLQVNELLEEKAATLNSNIWLKSYLDALIQESDNQALLADEIRQSVEPEIDEIKQAVGMTRAAQLDLEAVERKQKAIEILQHADELASLEPSVLAALNAGIPPKTMLNGEDISAPGSETSAEVITYQFILPEAYINADQNSTANYKDKLISTFEIPVEMADAVLLQPEYSEATALMNQMDQKEAELQENIEQYNQLIAEAAELNEKASVLEQAINSTESMAEAEGLKIEYNDVVAKRDVIVEALNDGQANITTISNELNELNQEVVEELATIDSEEIIATVEKTATVEPDEPTDNSLSLNPEEDPEDDVIRAEPTANASDSATKTAGKVIYNFATNNNFENYLKNYPEELEEEVFAITETPNYSEEEPIPLNLEMPSGVVYKVQVGAFRNPIASETFGKFAPLSGEQLNNGITRYTAGLFTQYASANQAKEVIREMGYTDAFVVAFENGQRIPLYTAREKALENKNDSVGEELTQGNNGQLETNDMADAKEVGNETVSIEKPDTTSPNAIEATDWRTQSGKYFTVQIGVFSKDVSADELFNAENIYSEHVNDGKVRYTSGRFDSLEEARKWKDKMVELGIKDAFLSAYLNGNRISIAQALGKTEEDANAMNQNKPSEQLFYQVVIGIFKDEVPSKTALAMLNMEDRWGIVQQPSPNGTMYVTKMVSSMEVVKMIQEEFKNQGVQVQQAITYKNGRRIESQDL